MTEFSPFEEVEGHRLESVDDGLEPEIPDRQTLQAALGSMSCDVTLIEARAICKIRGDNKDKSIKPSVTPPRVDW